MKKLWNIVVSPEVDAGIQKKIKKILKTHRSVGRPQRCLLCGADTTWTLNGVPVCPKCSVKYGFLGEQWLLDPCEVCGKQGEWATEGDPQHFLCYIHRDEWFHWKKPELEYVDYRKEPERWIQVWAEGWARFVAFMREREK